MLQTASTNWDLQTKFPGSFGWSSQQTVAYGGHNIQHKKPEVINLHTRFQWISSLLYPKKTGEARHLNFDTSDMGVSKNKGFLKWWYPTTIGFPTKNHHFAVFWWYHHLRKPPYSCIKSIFFRYDQSAHLSEPATWESHHHAFKR